MSESAIAILRVIHIVSGAFWVGGVITGGFLLLPAIKPTGEELTARFMAPSRLLSISSAAGLTTVVAGLILYGSIWAHTGFSGPAFWYAIGGHFAILALILDGAVVEPAVNKLRAFARRLSAQASSPTAEEDAECERLMTRVTSLTQLTAALLIISVSLMAIGRYV